MSVQFIEGWGNARTGCFCFAAAEIMTHLPLYLPFQTPVTLWLIMMSDCKHWTHHHMSSCRLIFHQTYSAYDTQEGLKQYTVCWYVINAKLEIWARTFSEANIWHFDLLYNFTCAETSIKPSMCYYIIYYMI